ncbi:MAG: SAM-dependent methyltransferase, partial [Desulfobacterales bacterium]|nr:SAM-dependent methyltransferase [Desulfobacterales bacterium]
MTDPNLMAKYRNQAQMLANKVRKRYKHLRKGFDRQNIEVFRLYDWDIPEIRAVVDWYAGHLVIAEYTRQQST